AKRLEADTETLELLLVAMATDYEAFLKIPHCRKQGLFHQTHMSSYPAHHVIMSHISKMENDRIKVSLSMKVVNQGTEKDLNPSNAITEQGERQRRPFHDSMGQNTLKAQEGKAASSSTRSENGKSRENGRKKKKPGALFLEALAPTGEKFER
uniref:Uncharacterized protein n=1 Tax=Suricata suricatta TaxID=37032 RepID=A0A673TCJ6_SURSU